VWSVQTRKSVKTITTGEALEGLQVCSPSIHHPATQPLQRAASSMVTQL
jgi:hypothetical protein